MGIVRFIGYIHVLVFDQFSALEPCSHHLANRIDRVDAPLMSGELAAVHTLIEQRAEQDVRWPWPNSSASATLMISV